MKNIIVVMLINLLMSFVTLSSTLPVPVQVGVIILGTLSLGAIAVWELRKAQIETLSIKNKTEAIHDIAKRNEIKARFDNLRHHYEHYLSSFVPEDVIKQVFNDEEIKILNEEGGRITEILHPTLYKP